jgi:putative FmdB family regulatory protein
MPLYEYVCDACRHRFEIIQKFSDGPPDACPSCGKGPVVRQLSSPAIQFKGSGWYVTDYAGKGKSGDNETKPAAAKNDAPTGGGTGESSTPSESKKSDAPASTPAATKD